MYLLCVDVKMTDDDELDAITRIYCIYWPISDIQPNGPDGSPQSDDDFEATSFP